MSIIQFRRCSTGSNGGNTPLSDGYDCGSSSGYGSPGSGGTPMASPAPNSYLTPGLLSRVVGYMNDSGFCDEQPVTQPQPLALSQPPTSHFNAMTTVGSKQMQESLKVNDENSPGSDDGRAAPVAVDDGFSNDEIAQFAQLLCSPKKAPPSKYQCHICYQTGHYISDCPMRFNSPYEELTPYQGRKKCYGEFQCQQCKRKWTSQNSVANEAQSCIKCHVPVFPHKQLPVDKAVALGLVKAQRVAPSKLAPIGHGRPPFSANRQ
uniref:Zf-3CxxC domain-containing protein n=1 Tax=Steinernema glaseri TaxID=37863 RepID=A0A1I7ZJL6_9BILA